MNQCDGCNCHAPVDEDGIHRNPDGTAYMACEKSKYEQEELKLPGKTYWMFCVYAKTLEDVQNLTEYLKKNTDRFDFEDPEEYVMRRGDPFSADEG